MHALSGYIPCLVGPIRSWQGEHARNRGAQHASHFELRRSPTQPAGFGKPAEKKLSKQKACPCGSGLAFKARRCGAAA